MLFAGSLLLLISAFKNKKSLLLPWKNKSDSIALINFGLLGMLAVQYTFFITIKHSNAATATVLQYIGPVFIACYYSFKEKRVPASYEIAAIVFALIGTFLIVTHGQLDKLSMTPTAFVWGIISAVALATYSIIPVNLLNKYEETTVTGWGMLIGGISLSFVHAPWRVTGIWDLYTVLCTLFIFFFGTAVAFYCYLKAVKTIGATTTSLLACAEPVSAAIIAVVWLNTPFGIFDWSGMIAILITILLLTKTKHA